MSHILAFHIGPVQEFISTARRTQDWWMGSWLIAHLSNKAMETVEQHGGKLLIPSERPPVSADKAGNADTPNKFIATVQSADAAKAAEQAVRSEWQRIALAVKENSFARVPGDLWKPQVNDFLEIYWTVCQGDDREARNFAYNALDARKRLRNFSQTKQSGEKCTLCGQRSSLHDGDGSRQGVRNFWARAAKSGVRVRPEARERLCAVCAIKRTVLPSGALKPTLNKDDGHFPSTSSIAAATFKAALLISSDGSVRKALEAHFALLPEIGAKQQVDRDCLPELARRPSEFPEPLVNKLLTYDGELFYPETFREKRFLEEYPTARETILERLKKDYDATEAEILDAFPDVLSEEIAKGAATLRVLYKTANVHPSSYFAALMMDGDHMGAFFGKATEEQAQAISQQLSQFAREEAKRTVERHLGRLIYAGGDDALALLPLEEALPCARELWLKFNEAVAKAVKDKTLAEGVHPPTPSIGIAIAHYLAPLDGVLAAMQRAERAAKNTYERNALCIHVLKRSGEEVHVGTHWEYAGLDALESVIQVVDAFRDGTLTMKFAHALADEVRGLAGKDMPHDACAAELRRLAKRHSLRDEATKAKANADSLARSLADMVKGINTAYSERKDISGIEEVSNWVLLARFIASGGRDEE